VGRQHYTHIFTWWDYKPQFTNKVHKKGHKQIHGNNKDQSKPIFNPSIDRNTKIAKQPKSKLKITQ